MDKFLDFLANHYQTFGIISIIILFALIGIIASSKNKNKKDTSDGENNGQPIKVEENKIEETNDNVPTLVSKSNVDISTPSLNESIFEPSLDQFESKASNESSQQLSPEQINGINSQPTLVIEDQSKIYDSSVTEVPTLIIEDKQSTQPVSQVPQMTPANEVPTLIIEDKQSTQPVSQVPQMTPANEVPTLIIEDKQSTQPTDSQTNINNI